MAAFDRVKSGIPEMDLALDNIRLGDNVVWRVSDLDQFRLFMEPYVRQAIEDKRNLIYFRFAIHNYIEQEFDPAGALSGVVHVYDVSGRNCRVYNNVADEHLVITC